MYKLLELTRKHPFLRITGYLVLESMFKLGRTIQLLYKTCQWFTPSTVRTMGRPLHWQSVFIISDDRQTTVLRLVGLALSDASRLHATCGGVLHKLSMITGATLPSATQATTLQNFSPGDYGTLLPLILNISDTPGVVELNGRSM